VFVFPLYLRARVYTVPEFLQRRYDGRIRLYFSALTLFLNIAVDTAGTLFAGGLIIHWIYPFIPIWQGVAMLGVLAALYTVTGGLRAVMYTDVVQAIILLLGSVVLAVMAFAAVGGWSEGLANVPAEKLQLIRAAGDKHMPWPAVLSGVFLLGFYFWGMNQFMVQRVLGAKNTQHARWGALFAGLLKLPVLILMVLPGILAIKLLPDLKNPDLVFPALMVKLLPVGLLGLMLAGLLAAIMSSLDSTINSASTLVTMDFVKSFKKDVSEKKLLTIGRITTALFFVVAILWAPFIESFGTLFKYLQKVLSYSIGPIVAVFVLGIFSRRITSNAAWISLMLGTAFAVVIFVIKEILPQLDIYVFSKQVIGIHFLYVAPIIFVVTLAILISINRYTRSEPVEEALLWRKSLYDREALAMRFVSWYKDYRILSIGLLILTGIVIAWFW
jgi:SSS family solute:Na+ symporter